MGCYGMLWAWPSNLSHYATRDGGVCPGPGRPPQGPLGVSPRAKEMGVQDVHESWLVLLVAHIKMIRVKVIMLYYIQKSPQSGLDRDVLWYCNVIFFNVHTLMISMLLVHTCIYVCLLSLSPTTFQPGEYLGVCFSTERGTINGWFLSGTSFPLAQRLWLKENTAEHHCGRVVFHYGA